MPGSHGVHVVALLLTTPDLAPISVMDPGLHVTQATVGEAEYMPGPHGVHVVALLLTTPDLAPISVMDPGLHVTQATVGEAEYMPGPHASRGEGLCPGM
jgi:hypothetical protein